MKILIIANAITMLHNSYSIIMNNATLPENGLKRLKLIQP